MDIMSSYIDLSSKRYVFFILCLISLFLGIGEWVARSVIVPISNTTPHRINAIYTEQNENVVVGDSHIFRGFISGDYFLNLGMGGTTIPMMKITIEQYFKYRNPGKVIIEASPQLFSQRAINGKTQSYDEYFNQNNSLPVKMYIFEPGIGSWIEKIKSIDDFQQLLLDKKNADSYVNLTGDWWVAKSHDERIESTKKRIKRQEPNLDEALEYIEIYKEIIDSLIDRGADVCLLRTPVDETYLELVKDNPSFSKAMEIFKSIAIEKNVCFIDFQTLDYDFTLDKFLNQDHLTPRASIEFSKLVNQACYR